MFIKQQDSLRFTDDAKEFGMQDGKISAFPEKVLAVNKAACFVEVERESDGVTVTLATLHLIKVVLISMSLAKNSYSLINRGDMSLPS